uniref:Uncharacterized protein n=1 Tax=Gouania willdenowi TaxID=441366 RepID=A0A8C5I1S6_GOUWI
MKTINDGASLTFPISRLFALILLTWDSAMSALEAKMYSYPGFQFLELLLAAFHSQIFCFIKAVLQVFDRHLQILLHPLQMSTGVSLHLLLDSQGIVPAPDLSIQSGLHGVNHSLAVPLDLLHFLVFLCKFSVDFILHLSEFKLNTKNLGFFMLQGSLGTNLIFLSSEDSVIYEEKQLMSFRNIPSMVSTDVLLIQMCCSSPQA